MHPQTQEDDEEEEDDLEEDEGGDPAANRAWRQPTKYTHPSVISDRPASSSGCVISVVEPETSGTPGDSLYKVLLLV